MFYDFSKFEVKKFFYKIKKLLKTEVFKLLFVIFSLVVCQTATDLHKMAKWEGKGNKSRSKLVEILQGIFQLNYFNSKFSSLNSFKLNFFLFHNFS